MPQTSERSAEWETPTDRLWRALRLPQAPMRWLRRYRVPPGDLSEQRRLWVMELPTLIVAALVILTLPVFVATGSRYLLIWVVVACIASLNYVLVIRGRSRLVVTMTLLAATWLPSANLGHVRDPDVAPLSFMGGMFALLGAALLQPVWNTLVYGIMSQVALQVTAMLYLPSPIQSQLRGGIVLLTAMATAGSWATDRAFNELERALAHNRELGSRLQGINATLEATNAELESRVAQRTRDLEELSVRDELTGLYNRRYFTLEMDARQGEQRHCTILMADVDHFKAVNDTLGHTVGDMVLRRVAGVMRRQVRGEDFAARIGGEEFVVVLVDRDLAAGSAMAERLRCAVAGEAWPDIPVPGSRVTVSVGVAAAVLDSAEAVQDLMRRADQALYAAKAAGRNRVHGAATSAHAQPDPVGHSSH